MADIAEQICLAIDEIVTERIKSINFDTTITAIIVDNKNASNNQYICSNGTSQFVAYSKDTTYEINDSVQVTIPNNDYSKQKVIIGRYVAENDKPYTYVKPFSTIIDVTSNLAIGPGDSIFSLLANDPVVEEIPIWSKTFDEKFTGFNRLGLMGQFRSWLSALKPISGNYGYKLYVLTTNGDLIVDKVEMKEEENGEQEREFILNYKHELLLKGWSQLYSNILNESYLIDGELNKEFVETDCENIEEVLKANPLNPLDLIKVTPDEWFDIVFEKIGYDKEEVKAEFSKLLENCENITKLIIGTQGQLIELELSSLDMYGDPYNFQGFFEQEKVYDISRIKNIISMHLFFYQESGSFIDKDEKLIPYWEEKFKYNFLDNLFTKGPYVCLGYDLSGFNSEEVILYTLDDDTYLFKDGVDPALNKKTIRLRWLHEFENGQVKVVTEDSELTDYEIRWYRYKLGAPSADEYSGVYWERKDSTEESKFTFVLDPEVNAADEQIKAIVIHNDKIIRSNILTFTNEDGAVSGATANYLAGLSIWCEDESYGNYYIYGQNNRLTDESQGNIVRLFQAEFANATIVKNIEDNHNTDRVALALTEAKSITWEFPLTGSMIIANGFNYNYKNAQVLEGDSEDKKYKQLGYYNDATIKVENDTIYITRYWNEKTGQINGQQEYTINKTYNATSINNTVKCTIEKNSIVYSATKDLSFGLVGTNGSDATVVIDFDNNRTALNAELPKDENNKSIPEEVRITAHLYDANHKEVDFNNVDLGIECKWKWKHSKEEVNEKGYLPYKDLLLKPGETKNVCYISHSVDLNLEEDNYFCELECEISNFGDYDLITYKAIPIRKNAQYRNYVGPIEVLYNSSGYADYYKKPCELWYCEEVNAQFDIPLKDINQLNNIKLSWQIYNPLNENSKFIGSMSENNILQPSTLYFKDANPYGIICRDRENEDILWVQPLVILQNNYPSAVINKWDGKTLELNENEGYILSTAIAAGKKNNNNTFSGVMIGDWSPLNTAEDIAKLTGVYGLHEGAVSFAFKEDGTAFIGKSGLGRIEFNGNSGEIFSSSWKDSGEGLWMDLDNAILRMDRKNSNEEYRYITLSAAETIYPLSIGTTSEVSGRDFMVEWNGSAHINNGFFSGDIFASTLIADDGQLNLQGILSIVDSNKNSYGYIGRIASNITNSGNIYGEGIGMYLKEGGGIAVKVTSANVGMTYKYSEDNNKGGYITITDTGIGIGGVKLTVHLPPDKQEGIYARFA